VANDCDVLSVHLALAPDTRGVINAKVFEVMRPGSFLINTSRAEVVDHDALQQAVSTRGIRAGLDVFADEPATPTGEFRDELLRLPCVYGTHHIGASTDQAQEAIAAETVRIVREFLEGGRAPNVVNLARKSPACCLLVVRHFDRVGVLASVFDQLKEAGINVQETENIVFDGAKAAIARIHLEQRPTEKTLASIRSGSADIIELSLVEL